MGHYCTGGVDHGGGSSGIPVVVDAECRVAASACGDALMVDGSRLRCNAEADN